MKTIVRYILPAIFLIIVLSLILFYNYEFKSTTIVSLITISLTYFYVVFTWEMTVNMKQDSELERRPYIVPDFFIENHNSLVFQIVNYGKTPALNVEIQVNPEIMLFKKKKLSDGMFNKPISIMPPNRKIKTSIGFSINIFQDGSFPTEYNIKIKYQNCRGKFFNDSFKIDFDYMRYEVYVGRKDIHDVASELERINKKLENKK